MASTGGNGGANDGCELADLLPGAGEVALGLASETAMLAGLGQEFRLLAGIGYSLRLLVLNLGEEVVGLPNLRRSRV